MKKSVIAIVLAIATVLALVSCNSSGESPKKQRGSAKQKVETQYTTRSKSSFQNDSYLGGYSFTLPSASTSTTGKTTATTCKSCHGTGVCSTCHGEGRYPNPYDLTRTIACTSCDLGKCRLCHGTGVW